mgnify:CR=1 FL=1
MNAEMGLLLALYLAYLTVATVVGGLFFRLSRKWGGHEVACLAGFVWPLTASAGLLALLFCAAAGHGPFRKETKA